jgi:ABC-type amino acid transport system permease subunit
MILTISVGAGIILAAILLVLAGMSRMFGKKMRKDATEWTVDIIKGLTQVLISVPIVFVIYYLATLIFKSSGWFVSPF